MKTNTFDPAMPNRRTGGPSSRRRVQTPWLRAAIGALAVLGVALPAAPATALTDAELLEALQHTAFDYFWNEANPTTGLIKDRSTVDSACSIAAVGFGLTAICIGIDHGWVSREDGRARVLAALNTFWSKPQGTAASGTIGYKGFFYHFLDMNTGLRTWSSELSTIDTALLLAGVLDAKQYFDTDDPLDVQVRDLADDIYQRVDWMWARDTGPGIRMGWKPGTGFTGYGFWVGYNEAMILYILALGSPTYTVPDNSWLAWTNGYNACWGTQYGYTYLTFPPLFGHQYSHCWIDFRDQWDAYMASKGIDYFENSRRATYAQRAYCIANPLNRVGYGADLWGLTASDDPVVGYQAHGAPPSMNDNGTITPTAPASSIAFAPEIVLPCLQNLYNTYGMFLWGPYGFRDAFNLTLGWWDQDYIGIDQGPVIIMIENHLNGSVWRRFTGNADVRHGLTRAGFVSATAAPAADAHGSAGARGPVLYPMAPNPFSDHGVIAYRLPLQGHVSLQLYDVQGRRVRTLVSQPQSAGDHWVSLDGSGLPSGVYFYRLESNGQRVTQRCLLTK